MLFAWVSVGRGGQTRIRCPQCLTGSLIRGAASTHVPKEIVPFKNQSRKSGSVVAGLPYVRDGASVSSRPAAVWASGSVAFSRMAHILAKSLWASQSEASATATALAASQLSCSWRRAMAGMKHGRKTSATRALVSTLLAVVGFSSNKRKIWSPCPLVCTAHWAHFCTGTSCGLFRTRISKSSGLLMLFRNASSGRAFLLRHRSRIRARASSAASCKHAGLHCSPVTKARTLCRKDAAVKRPSRNWMLYPSFLS